MWQPIHRKIFIQNGTKYQQPEFKKLKKHSADDNESIASSDEEFAEERAEKLNKREESSDEDHETAQEKRLRLAKKYLSEIEAEGKSIKKVIS